MESSLSVLPVLAVIFLSTFARSALGFGDALIAMPLLAMLVSVEVATPLVAFGASTIAITILVGAWKQVDVRATWRLVVSTLVGIPLGLLLLKAASQAIVEALLGLVLVGFGLYSLIAPKLPTLGNEKLSYAFGLIAGVLGGAYNTNGPPVVVYGALRRWSAERFRATMQGYFLPTGLTILVSHGLAGLWTPTVLRLYVYALPVIVTAVIVGGWVNKRIAAGRFHRAIYGFLVLMGIILILRVF
jgi:uncharacterized membrane protein YfcA